MVEPGYSGPKEGTHLSKLNGSHEKVLDAINPCAKCGRMLSEHKAKRSERNDKDCKYQRAASLEFVLYDLRHTFATRMVGTGCSLPALAAILGLLPDQGSLWCGRGAQWKHSDAHQSWSWL